MREMSAEIYWMIVSVATVEKLKDSHCFGAYIKIYTYVPLLLCYLGETGTGNVHIILLKICEFRENLVKGTHRFFSGVNGIILTHTQ